MKKIGIISKDNPDNPFITLRKQLFLEHLAEHKVTFFPWDSVDDIAKLNEFDLVYLSSLGPIEGRKQELLNFIRNLGGLETKVINDPETMIENFDKRYLLFLQENGIPVIPTTEVSNSTQEDLSNISFPNYTETIVKPRYFSERSLGLMKTSEIDTEEEWEDYKAKYGELVLAQPFIPTIQKTGERSVVFVGDTYSHTVRRPREQRWDHFGTVRASHQASATKQELDTAERILSTPYHISRFDFIADNGTPLISEVEMINPNMWVGRNMGSIDPTFMGIFSEYVNSQLNS